MREATAGFSGTDAIRAAVVVRINEVAHRDRLALYGARAAQRERAS